MLEARSLCKTYKPKKGVPVLAVDHVSLRFPEKGMVFLLGKSGSGKSTMLNLLGGLDKYDDGEIIIKGISSKDFSQQRFDSYRNTYVGFIFQEYNVLEEFTVGANIALALELQGRKATDEELNRILQTVDLEGYGNRKPNELSGGQKQRVAIARALVKNPEIIMADEPTGALDSATGRQVLDTLKKLSAEKLVIIVSHDREYAEAYADRIIELADGKVIRDVENTGEKADTEKTIRFRQTSIEIPPDYHLTEEDRIQINEYLDKLKSGASLMLPSQSQKFKPTDESKIPVQDGSKFSLIKSKLPMSSAFKIGCSSLKHKRFRLVMTILLSVAAFTLFALVDTFSAYDHINACTDSIVDGGLDYLSLNRKVRTMRRSWSDKELDPEDEDNYYYSTDGQHFTDDEITQVSEDLGIPMTGIFVPVLGNLKFTRQFDSTYKFSESEYSLNLMHFCGFAEVSEKMLNDMHYDMVAGSLPRDGENEIAISALLCETFEKAGYLSTEKLDENSFVDEDYIEMLLMSGQELPDDLKQKLKGKYETISGPKEMVGKKLRLLGTDYTVTGVVDTHVDLARYEVLTKSSEGISNSDEIVRFMLQREFSKHANYSLTGCAMVGKNIIPALAEKQPQIFGASSTLFLQGSQGVIRQELHGFNVTDASLLKQGDVIWVDGEKTTLADNEIIISLDNLSRLNGSEVDMDFIEQAQDLFDSKTTPDMKQLKKLWNEFTSIPMELTLSKYAYSNTKKEPLISSDNLKIVGIFVPGNYYASNNTFALSPKLFAEYMTGSIGAYDSAIGAVPESREAIKAVVQKCFRDGIAQPDYQYEINSAETLELDYINNLLKEVAKFFFWIGFGFAVFAALLMANFITTSIHYKRQEIGILRAIGSRSADVFRIFNSESLVIAMINFVFSTGICAGAVAFINHVIRSRGILVTILHFGLRQMFLLFAVSVGVAALASFLPVKHIASKKPIDAIRDK